MIKLMGPDDPQRAKLIEADEIASKIALAETDDQTRRAAVLYCLSATIDGFPAGLISNSRRFIDCIDVEDIIVDGPPGASSSASSLSATSLHCTLFLFDDKLMIVKRPGNGEKSGRLLSGLDEVEKLAKTGGLPLGMKKSGMSCKGVFDLCDVVVADVGDAGKTHMDSLAVQLAKPLPIRIPYLHRDSTTRSRRQVVRSAVPFAFGRVPACSHQPRPYPNADGEGALFGKPLVSSGKV